MNWNRIINGMFLKRLGQLRFRISNLKDEKNSTFFHRMWPKLLKKGPDPANLNSLWIWCYITRDKSLRPLRWITETISQISHRVTTERQTRCTPHPGNSPLLPRAELHTTL